MTEEQLKKMKMVVKTEVFTEEHTESDGYGVYSTGVFASSKTSTTLVSYVDGLWRMAVQSKTPLGLVQLKAFKRTFIPDNVKMAMVFGSREDLDSDNIYHLYQLK